MFMMTRRMDDGYGISLWVSNTGFLKSQLMYVIRYVAVVYHGSKFILYWKEMCLITRLSYYVYLSPSLRGQALTKHLNQIESHSGDPTDHPVEEVCSQPLNLVPAVCSQT
jgi:hypothetical protein